MGEVVPARTSLKVLVTLQVPPSPPTDKCTWRDSCTLWVLTSIVIWPILLVSLTLKVLYFWKFTSYCSLKPLWSGMGEVVPARTSLTLHPPSPPIVHQLSRLARQELIFINASYYWSIQALTLKVLVTIDAQWEGMGDVGSARYEPALLPPCPTIRVLSYSN